MAKMYRNPSTGNAALEQLNFLRTNAPMLPGDTCPYIDRIQARRSAVEADLALIREEIANSRLKARDGLVSQLHDVEATLAGLSELLEIVRAANEALRRSSYYWYNATKQVVANKIEHIEPDTTDVPETGEEWFKRTILREPNKGNG